MGKLKLLVIVHFSCRYHQQSRAYNFLYAIPADWDFPIVNHKTIPTMKVYLFIWILLSEGNQSKSWEKVWANWNCLSLVTSYVVGTSIAEHTTSDMSYKQMKTLSSFTTRQPIQILKKSVTSVFFVVDHFLMLLAPVEQSIQLLIGAEQQLLLYHSVKKRQSIYILG